MIILDLGGRPHYHVWEGKAKTSDVLFDTHTQQHVTICESKKILQYHDQLIMVSVMMYEMMTN